MERHILDWLNVIADDAIRESAIEQWDNNIEKVNSLGKAILEFAIWHRTKEKKPYWVTIHCNIHSLKLRPYTAPNGDYFDGKEWKIEKPVFKPHFTPHKLDFSEKESVDMGDVLIISDEFSDVKWNDDKAIEHAILLLESKGYKITKL